MADPTTPPSSAPRLVRHAWLAVPALALAFLAFTTALRVRRVDYVSNVAGRSPEAGAPALLAGAPWHPRLIIPGHRDESYEWLDLTRQMLAERQVRVRHVDYEDAPGGREVFAASPYRWWLGLVAVWRHASSGAGLGPSLEWAALYADPILLLLLGAATAAFAYRLFGASAAALLSASLAALYPFASQFLPAVPDDGGLCQFLILWSLLPLAAGALTQGPSTRLWFAAAGILGGIGVWTNVSWELPILAGAGLGALLAALLSRRAAEGGPPAAPLPWRLWGFSGAVTCLAAYLAEFFPSYLGRWELHAVHPLLGLAWLGGAEVTARLEGWIAGRREPLGVKGSVRLVLAVAAIAAVPAALWLSRSWGFLSVELESMRLSLGADGPAAPTFWAWLIQNGFTAHICVTLLPLLILVPAVVVVLARAVPPSARASTALLVGPVLVALGFSCRQIGWWSGADAALLALLVAAAGAGRALPRPRLVAALGAILGALILIPGAVLLWPKSDLNIHQGLSENEVEGLVERDMAGWLADRVGSAGAVVLAPPNQTVTLYYYGGIKGLATFGWADREGFQSAVRILSATTPEEAQELIGIHGVTHIIIPSWDPFMDAYAQVGAGQVGGTFLDRLHQWNLPRWLTPVPYLVPGIAGFEGQSAIVLEVVDEQDDATALARIAEYFVDMNQLSLAEKAGEGLRRFPADLGALLARAQVENATGDADAFASSSDTIVRRIGSGADKELAWDQRVALCVLLVQARHVDLALPRLRQCLAEVDEMKLRTMSTILLYRLHVLSKALNLGIADPRLRTLSLELLPADLRSRVE